MHLVITSPRQFKPSNPVHGLGNSLLSPQTVSVLADVIALAQFEGQLDSPEVDPPPDMHLAMVSDMQLSPSIPVHGLGKSLLSPQTVSVLADEMAFAQSVGQVPEVSKHLAITSLMQLRPSNA